MHYFNVVLDRETSERCGAGGHFQVVQITNVDGKDLTSMVDVGTHFPDWQSLKEVLAKELNVQVSEIELNEE